MNRRSMCSALFNHASIDILFRHDTDRAQLLHALFPDQASISNYTAWYKQTTTDLIKQYSYTIGGLPGTRVDIVRNVINIAAVHWAADYLCGIPLKTAANPKGVFTEQEVYDMLSLLFTCVFINVQPEHGWALEHGAKKVGDIINAMIEKSIKEAAPQTASVTPFPCALHTHHLTCVLMQNPISGIFSKVSSIFWPSEEKLCYPFLSRLAQSGRPMPELIGQVIGLAVGSSVNYSQGASSRFDSSGIYLDQICV